MKKKVLHVLQSNRFSGAENVVLFIISNLNQEYDFLYASAEGQIEDILKDKSINYKLFYKLNYTNLKEVIKMYNPDVIHAHDVRATLLCTLLKGSRKLISHIHVNNDDMRKINLKTVLLLLSSINISHFFWVSQSCFNSYIFKNQIKNKSEILDNILSQKDIIKKCDRDLNMYNYDVVYIGRLAYQKNPEKLLAVCEKLIQRERNIRIAIVGTGPLEYKVKEYVKKKRINENITLVGYMNNPLKLLSDAKVMIMTSRYEGTPMIALEALALGVPIVSTPVDGMKNLIDHGVNGYLSNEDTKIADYVLDIINNTDIYLRLQQHARKKFDLLCDEENYFKSIRKEYK